MPNHTLDASRRALIVQEGTALRDGLEAQDGDFVVAKMRISARQDTKLEQLLQDTGRDTVIVTGSWTNMPVEHAVRCQS